ncbi:MAG: CoA pyrophosphatase [Chlorobi bacterium]|nr:CoA pyrophosphatase [Chlorobiota bacterium]
MQKTVEILKHLLSLPLPGEKAHKVMSSSKRYTGKGTPDPEKAKKSSVFILLYKENGKWIIPMIKRPEYKGIHGGQISLPGGKFDESDTDLLQTAYRETYEEIGIEKDNIIFAGTLSALFIPNSNFIVIPQVGVLNKYPQFRPDEREVEKIVKFPLNILFDKSRVKTFTKVVRGTSVIAPYYDFNGNQIWGATAMILNEFAEIIRNSELNETKSGISITNNTL